MREKTSVPSRATKDPWTKPELHFDGDLRDLVLGGGGKVSAAAGDPGDGLKPPGGEP